MFKGVLMSLVLGGWCAAGAAGQTVASLNPAADAFVNSSLPDSNFGAAGGLGIAGSANDTGESITLLRFDASPAIALFDATYETGNWQIQSASLQLTATNPLNPIFHTPSVAGPVSAIWQSNDNWVEGGGTPNDPGTDGITFTALSTLLSPSDEAIGAWNYDGSVGGSQHFSLVLTDGFLDDLRSGGLVTVRLAPGDSDVSGVFKSLNFTNSSARPVLTITAGSLPEPADAMLLVLPSLYFMQSRRRTKLQPRQASKGSRAVAAC
jgi:hypothetical protein